MSSRASWRRASGDLLLLALFGEEAEGLPQTIRARGRREETLTSGGVDQGSGGADSRDRQDRAGVGRQRDHARGVGERGVSVRRGEERPVTPGLEPQPAAEVEEAAPVVPRGGRLRPRRGADGRYVLPGSELGAALFVEEGDVVEPADASILEAMKLMNEIKAEIEGVVRAIHVRNAEPVNTGSSARARAAVRQATRRPLGSWGCRSTAYCVANRGVSLSG